MTSGYAIATLAVFIISQVFIIHPISIPTPRPIPRIPINLITAPILAIAILWAAQCLDPAIICNGIVGTEGVKPYNILILFFSLAYMTITLDITGILQAAAYWVSNQGGSNGRKLYLYFYTMLTLLSILLGNDPVILSGTAFLVYYIQVAKLELAPWMMAEFAAANTASMVLFVGNPTNVVICEGFSVNNAAFTAHTILPFIACNVFCFAALAFQYRKQVRRSNPVAQQDPGKALLDPFGAWVGSIMLGATLILCLVVSFFGIDVWMISLPFALAKFLFDVGRDYYRFCHGMCPMASGSLKAMESGADEISAGKNGHLETDDSPQSSFIAVNDQQPSSRPLMEQIPHLGYTHSRRSSLANTLISRSDDATVGEWHSPSPQTELKPDAHLLPINENAARITTEQHLNIETNPPLHAPIDEERLQSSPKNQSPVVPKYSEVRSGLYSGLYRRFPVLVTAFPRLPFALIPFAFSQFILIEALNHQGWIAVFGDWLIRASRRQIHPTIWLVGVLGVVLCNLAGTNIGATILLTQIVRAANLPYDANRAAAIALAVASNIGAVSFTFSASLVGLLWRGILEQKGIKMRQRDFAYWNLLPLFAMTTVGLGVVSAEMAVLFGS